MHLYQNLCSKLIFPSLSSITAHTCLKTTSTVLLLLCYIENSIVSQKNINLRKPVNHCKKVLVVWYCCLPHPFVSSNIPQACLVDLTCCRGADFIVRTNMKIHYKKKYVNLISNSTIKRIGPVKASPRSVLLQNIVDIILCGSKKVISSLGSKYPGY